jgi:hypothetical protein
MSYENYDPQEFRNYFRLFEIGCYTPDGHCPEWPLFKSPEATELLRNKAASYGGLISVSHFICAFRELVASGTIKQLRAPKPTEAEAPELTVEEYRKLPTRTVVMRYQSDRDFKDRVDSLVARGLI